MYKAMEITNHICDQSLKSNIMQGLQNMDIQYAPIYNELKGHSKKIKAYVCRKDETPAVVEKKKKVASKKIINNLTPPNNEEVV